MCVRAHTPGVKEISARRTFVVIAFSSVHRSAVFLFVCVRGLVNLSNRVSSANDTRH